MTLQSKIADQLLVDFDALARPNHERPCGRQFEKARIGLRSAQYLLGETKTPGSSDGDCRGNAKPQQGQRRNDDYCGRLAVHA
jgi:hypothetical protein